jgi:hypothetical protein
MATHPRSSDYPTKDPEAADLAYEPYALRNTHGVPNERRDVEPNTSGRSSRTPELSPPGRLGNAGTHTSEGQDTLSPYGQARNAGAASQGHVTTPDLRKAGPEDGPAKVAAGG